MCSTQRSMNFFLLISVKMPTTVGISTLMSMKNSILGLSETCSANLSMIFFITSGAGQISRWDSKIFSFSNVSIKSTDPRSLHSHDNIAFLFLASIDFKSLFLACYIQSSQQTFHLKTSPIHIQDSLPIT